MTIIQLKYFLAVCDLKRIRVAAEQLHISEPTISISIKRLEEDLGRPLFTRNRKQLELTEDGRLLRRKAAEVVAHFDRLETEIAESRANSHVVRVAAPSSLGEYLCSNHVASFTEKHPTILFEIPPAPSIDAVKLVLDEKIELAVCDRLAVYSNQLEFIPLLNTSTYCYIRKDNHLAGEKLITPEIAKKEKVILWSERAMISQEIIAWFKGSGIEPNLFMYSNRRSFSLNMVRRHDAMAFCLDYVMDQEAMQSPFPPEDIATIRLNPDLRFTIGIVKKKSVNLGRDAQCFFDFCKGFAVVPDTVI